MSTVDSPETTPDRVAATLRDADFVRLVATADGDALAASGLLARALEAAAVPFQVSLAAVPEPPSTDADCTVAVGHSFRASGHAATDASVVSLVETPLSVAAADVARELDADAVAPVLALAGAACTGFEPSGTLLEAANLDRRDGVALPTTDRVDGLAGSTLVHADFSGDNQAAEAALEDVDGDRELASLVALSAVQDAPPRAAEAVERALRPYVCDRFETLGGYADVLDSIATDAPGLGIALALGNDVETAALETWRARGQRVHEALREADTGRYDGVFVARVESDVTLAPVARLLYAYRSPEPVVLVVTDGEAAVATDSADSNETDVADALRSASTALDGRATARDGHGTATFDGSTTDFVSAFREAL